MSIFSSVKEKATPAILDAGLQQRYDHLCLHAKNLSIEIDDFLTESGLADGITPEALDRFQRLITVESLRQDILGGVYQKQGFQIDCTEHLDWYLSKRMNLINELEGVKAQYEKLLSQIKARQEGLDFLFKAQAETFIQHEYQRTGKKTMILPHGTCAVRSTQPSWKVGDEAILQEWLEKLSTEDKATFEVYPKSWTRNLEALKFNASKGVKIPGLDMDPGGDKISLRLPKEKE